MPSRKPTREEPAERAQTRRAALREALIGGSATARALSAATGMTERDVLGHLEHLARSLRGALRIEPAECLACGFSFETRTRLRAPSRCPACKSERIAPPRFGIDPT